MAYGHRIIFMVLPPWFPPRGRGYVSIIWLPYEIFFRYPYRKELSKN